MCSEAIQSHSLPQRFCRLVITSRMTDFMRMLAQDLNRTARNALEARKGDDLKEALSQLYRAGTALHDLHAQFRRTADGEEARALRERLATREAEVQARLRSMVPAVVQRFGAWEARFITTPQFHSLIPGG